MPLTPEDVSNKRFTPVRLREGYDMGEVDQFLDEVEAELARLTKENDDLRAKLSAATVRWRLATPAPRARVVRASRSRAGAQPEPEPEPEPVARRRAARADDAGRTVPRRPTPPRGSSRSPRATPTSSSRTPRTRPTASSVPPAPRPSASSPRPRPRPTAWRPTPASVRRCSTPRPLERRQQISATWRGARPAQQRRRDASPVRARVPLPPKTYFTQQLEALSTGSESQAPADSSGPGSRSACAPSSARTTAEPASGSPGPHRATLKD